MDTTVAVTGAASGLGRVIATELLARGHCVVIVDQDEARPHSAARELGADHAAPVAVVAADLSTATGIHAVADRLAARAGLTGLVNNAGGWRPGDQYPDAAPDTWLAAITLNLLAPMLLTQLLWPTLSAGGAGAVVNVGSSAGVGDDAYGSPEYAAAKAGVHRFTTSLGSRSDVRVMGVVPGWIGLERAYAEWAALSPEQQRATGALIPPESIARTVADLLDHGRPGEVVPMLHADDVGA